MSVGRMSVRFVAGVGAWLLGAGAATAGCLLAVSALGQGLDPAPSQQLSMAAVNRALHAKAPGPNGSGTRVSPISSSATPMPHPHGGSPTPSVPVPYSGAKDLVSPAGSVRAGCEPTGAVSVVRSSPAQGYRASQPVTGPAGTTEVTFTGTHKSLTMTISCSDGLPAAVTKVTHGDR